MRKTVPVARHACLKRCTAGRQSILWLVFLKQKAPKCACVSAEARGIVNSIITRLACRVKIVDNRLHYFTHPIKGRILT